MIDSYSEFGLLLASIWGARDKPEMVIRGIATDDLGSQLVLGADSAGHRHVLAPITSEYAFTPQKGEAIELTEWTDPELDTRFLDLVCRSDQLAQVFAVMVDSMVDRMQERRESAHVAVLGTLEEWRRLLRPARELTEEAARGLFGELIVLRDLCRRNALFATDSWLGPSGAIHDFMTAGGDIEVKSSAKDGRDVVISGVAQLDRVSDVPLCLIRLHVESSPVGQSLGELAEEIIASGALRGALLERLEAAGYLLGVDQDKHRFIVPEEPVAWEVATDFPGLRSDDLPEARRAAITRISYTLDLVGAEGELSRTERESWLDRMMSA